MRFLCLLGEQGVKEWILFVPANMAPNKNQDRVLRFFSIPSFPTDQRKVTVSPEPETFQMFFSI